jgi:F-type H+-transporting ATPase subunit b
VKRRIVLGVMVLVTAWSLWAMAQTGAGGPRPTPARPMAPMGAPPPGMRGQGQPMPGGGQLPPALLQRLQGMTPPAAPPKPGPTVRPEGAAEVSAAEKAAEEEKEENAPPADINWVDFGRDTPPYLAMVINFGILIAGYYYLGKKPIAAALKNRRDNIAREIEEATRMRKEAEKRAKHYQAKLERLEEEVQTTRDTLIRAGEAERERLVVEAEAKAERMRKDAEFLVEQELKQLRVDLQRDTVEAAIAAAEELLKKRVTQADQERLAEDYLADLAHAPGGPS